MPAQPLLNTVKNSSWIRVYCLNFHNNPLQIPLPTSIEYIVPDVVFSISEVVPSLPNE